MKQVSRGAGDGAKCATLGPMVTQPKLANENDRVVVPHDANIGSVAIVRNDVDRLIAIEGNHTGKPISVTLTHAGTQLVHDALEGALQDWKC